MVKDGVWFIEWLNQEIFGELGRNIDAGKDEQGAHADAERYQADSDERANDGGTYLHSVSGLFPE